jgi:pyrroline-5-carboxylate reductase
MILYTANEKGAGTVPLFLESMAAAGKFDAIDERLIDAASAISGCGPAFVYMFIEALADGGVMSGLPRDKAMLYAAETLIGAAEVVKQTGRHPGALKDAVCSPGGSTIQGVRVLEEQGLRGATIDAVIAAYQKTQGLG